MWWPESRLGRWLVAGGAAFVVVLVVTVGIFFLISGGEEGGREATAGRRVATKVAVNRTGAYAFNYPPSWRLRHEGRTSTVTAPGRTVIVSFGRGAEGSLRRAAARFAAEIAVVYRKVSLAAAQIGRIGRHPALTIAGTGRNASGVRIRFLAVTVATPRGNYAIAVYTSTAANDGRVVLAVQEILSSFRLTS